MTDRDAAADALAGRIFGAVLETFDVYAVYIGDRLGYYRALAADGPATSAELAARVGAAERHTREWLEQQVTTGYLSVDDVGAEPTARRYALPPG
ncbi:MAG TPA: SAM-dependent methyltransferase, partial [Actinomycetota bacterium]|nr:SAM-dependent methyltransferase [Actinomycetota bacterium]